MKFWLRLFGAVVCWFLTMLTIFVVTNHYLEVTLTSSLWQELVVVVGIAVAMIAILMTTLLFWLWVWIRKYG